MTDGQIRSHRVVHQEREKGSYRVIQYQREKGIIQGGPSGEGKGDFTG